MNYSPPNRTIPQTTKSKREAAFGRSIDWAKAAARGKEPARDIVIPGLDVAALQRQWGPETFGHPRLLRGDFRVPIEYGTWGPNYERVRNEALKVFIAQQAKLNLAFYADDQHPFRIYPGVYPAWDLRDQCWLLDQRQFIVEAYFRSEKPKPMDFELDPRWTEPYVIPRGHRPAQRGRV